MIIDIPYVADILTISHSRQALIDSRLLKENAKRISHDYRIGESVMKKSILSLSDKLLPSFAGPYIIEQVHTNGTCTIRLTPNQTKHINIRRLKTQQGLRLLMVWQSEVPPPGLLPRCLLPPHPDTSIKAPLALPQRDLCSTPLAYSNDNATRLGLGR